jgi:ATP-dependent Clp protease adaptor protein ClpS
MSEPAVPNEGGSTAVAEPVVRTKSRPKARPAEQTQTRTEPPYNVIILNDEEHTFDYVIELLTKIFRHATATAETLTWRIHNTGRAIVFTAHKELAELKRDQVLAYGPDPRMEVSKGPLDCYIEPAQDGG